MTEIETNTVKSLRFDRNRTYQHQLELLLLLLLCFFFNFFVSAPISMTIFTHFAQLQRQRERESNKIKNETNFSDRLFLSFSLIYETMQTRRILTIKFLPFHRTDSIMKFGRVFYERCQSVFAFGIHDKCDVPKANKRVVCTYKPNTRTLSVISAYETNQPASQPACAVQSNNIQVA